jgi:hypothetical protein
LKEAEREKAPDTRKREQVGGWDLELSRDPAEPLSLKDGESPIPKLKVRLSAYPATHLHQAISIVSGTVFLPEKVHVGDIQDMIIRSQRPKTEANREHP